MPNAYGVFRLSTDSQGNHVIGKLVFSGTTYTEACQYVRAAYAKGELPNGEPVDNTQESLKILDLEKRPLAGKPIKFSPGQGPVVDATKMIAD